MSRISLSEIPIPQSIDFKEETQRQLSNSQLQNYVTKLGIVTGKLQIGRAHV